MYQITCANLYIDLCIYTHLNDDNNGVDVRSMTTEYVCVSATNCIRFVLNGLHLNTNWHIIKIFNSILLIYWEILTD